jgi:hypothetical protein
VYGLRLEALIECEAIASENFRREWREHKTIAGCPDAFRDAISESYFRAEFRKRARRALAGIRAMRVAIGSSGPVLVRPIA